MSDAILEQLEPKPLWTRFFELKNTPRPSKDEQQAMQYLRDWADSHGLPHASDSVGNLCVRVPASEGSEQAKPIVIQNHVDIVVANADDAGDADAALGRIPVERGDFDEHGEFTASATGNWIYAPVTTLGADNGIGCASAMAVAETDGLKHPPLELLFTVDEEEGMSGALQLEPEHLQMTGQTLINLDTEDDDELTIGSAGGCDFHIEWTRPAAAIDGGEAHRLSLHDLRGGHSGIEINSGRANAIRVLAQAMARFSERYPLRVARIKGGDRRNAIPRSCEATIIIDPAQRDDLQQILAEQCAVANQQFAGRDHTVNIQILPTDPIQSAFSVDDSQCLLDMLLSIPAGVFEMTAEIPHLPETSHNLAIIDTQENRVTIDSSARSTFDPGMQDVLATLHAIARQARASARQGNAYPGWKPNLQSPVMELTRACYQRLFDEPPKVLAVHAGLECGVLASKFERLDCISFGPNIRGNHAPGEHVEISSVAKSYDLLIALLADLAHPAD